MTLVFALLAVCGAAGLVFLLQGAGRTREERTFKSALREADGPGQDFARRLELLEEKIKQLDGPRGRPEPLEAAVSGCRGGMQTYENYRIAGRDVSRRQKQQRGTEPARPAQKSSSALRTPALSARMTAIWKEAEKNSDPLEIARALNMGVSEVELALKIKTMRPQWG